jgi:hypothetical protein
MGPEPSYIRNLLVCQGDGEDSSISPFTKQGAIGLLPAGLTLPSPRMNACSPSSQPTVHPRKYPSCYVSPASLHCMYLTGSSARLLFATRGGAVPATPETRYAWLGIGIAVWSMWIPVVQANASGCRTRPSAGRAVGYRLCWRAGEG